MGKFWLVGVICLASGTALAAPTCNTLDSIQKQLLDKYHEKPIANAIAGNGMPMIVFAAKDGATWTIVVVVPSQHLACLGGSGTAWQTTEQPTGDPS